MEAHPRRITDGILGNILFQRIRRYTAERVSRNARDHMVPRRPPPPIPTLGQLHCREPHWFWVCCDGCLRSCPLPLAPFVIRWGPDMSSDALRRNLRCKACGHRGASLQHPSWVDVQIGWQPFPALTVAENSSGFTGWLGRPGETSKLCSPFSNWPRRRNDWWRAMPASTGRRGFSLPSSPYCRLLRPMP